MGGGISKKVHAEEIEKREAKVGTASLIEPEGSFPSDIILWEGFFLEQGEVFQV